MLDMGFIPDIERICKLVPFTRQTLFFTAMPTEIRRITNSSCTIGKGWIAAGDGRQHHAAAGKAGRESHEKRDTLRRLIAGGNFKNAIIFCNRKTEVALLHRSLVRHGFNAAALHGDLDQSARTAALEAFRKGDVKLLIASDVAARGLDIPDVSHVFNFDVPHHADDYVHRIGRTGRAGKLGVAITIVSPSDQKSVIAIEKLIGQSIAWMRAAARKTGKICLSLGAKASPHRREATIAGANATTARRGTSAVDSAHVATLFRRCRSNSRHCPAVSVPRASAMRPQRAPAPREAPGHLPAFLLRPSAKV